MLSLPRLWARKTQHPFNFSKGNEPPTAQKNSDSKTPLGSPRTIKYRGTHQRKRLLSNLVDWWFHSCIPSLWEGQQENRNQPSWNCSSTVNAFISLANRARDREDENVNVVQLCPKCNLPEKNHSLCEACSILAGPGHWVEVKEFRGHLVCPPCATTWEKWHPDWTWEQFLCGDFPQNRKKEQRQARKVQVHLLTRQGKTLREIANILHTSRNTVMTDLHKEIGSERPTLPL